ncbi:MAG: VCBS repeat-containing protein, partial [Verrucomicrobiota bacterium]
MKHVLAVFLFPIVSMAAWPMHVIDNSSRGADGVRLADINRDGRLDVATGWEEGGLTRIYLHPGPDKVKAAWPMVTVGKTPSVEDAVFIDLDNDGAMDVISCCEGRQRSILVHWSPQDPGDASPWRQTSLSAAHQRMAWMFACPLDIDGRNGDDLVAAGKGGGAAIGWFSKPDHPRDEAGYQWHPISSAGWIMSLLTSDMDGDGDLDLVTSDRRGPLR